MEEEGKKRKQVSPTRRNRTIALTMNVSILALTLFTPERPSERIHRGLHTQKFIAEKNQYVPLPLPRFRARATPPHIQPTFHTRCCLT